MSTDLQELKTILTITNELDAALDYKFNENYPTQHPDGHNITIDLDKGAAVGISILKICVSHKNNDYAFTADLDLNIKEQSEPDYGVYPFHKCLSIKNLTYTPATTIITSTVPINIHKDTNHMGLYTYNDIVDMIMDVINTFRNEDY